MQGNEKNIFAKLNLLIEQNIDKSGYTIEDICLELGISRSQLFRLIKEQTNLSPSRFIRLKRLSKGKQLLEDTSLRIVEITSLTGFDSQQTFSKYFTEEFGVSPSDYRKNRETITEDTLPALIEPIELPENPAPNMPKAIPVLSGRKYMYGAIGIGLGVLVIGLLLSIKSMPFTNIGQMNAKSIAILPIASEDSTETLTMADGLTEQVRLALTSYESLKVISKNSSELFKNTTKSTSQIADELHVEYILDGTVKKIENGVRISLELVKASEDQTIWAKQYEGKTDNTIDFINKITNEVREEVHKRLRGTSATGTNVMPTKNLEAYQEYLKGKQLMLLRTKDKLEAAIERFDRAIALDPNFADAFAYKASAYHILGNSSFINMEQSIRLSEQNALAALQLDAENGLAYAALANGYRQQSKWEQAITTYQIALKYSPNDAQIIYWYSISLRSIGELDKAIEYSTKALSLDPLYPTILFGHIGNCSYAGKFKEAEESIKEGQALFSNYYMYYYVRAFYQLNLNNYEEALKDFQRASELSPHTRLVETYIAFCQGRLGQTAKVKAYLASLPPTLENYNLLAVVYAGLKDKEQCFRYLQLAAAQGRLPEYFKVSPLFKILHGDKRFDQLLEKFGLLDFKIPV
ncbi:helix-turn-helix domain-containing protein [Emticicia sp. 17c]|uniref:helix-turn-helix domain-containing protein n=1 Tax=Emticicia sp. 17c TaxID=3127704 RepID=UPI00301D41D4